MKRKPIARITMAAILYVLLLIGCDALDSAMDTMSKNLYEESGLVSADTSSADDVAGQVAGLTAFTVYDTSNTADIEKIAAQYGYSVESGDGKAIFDSLKNVLDEAGLGSLKVMTPQEQEAADALTKSVSKALASEAAKKELVDQLGKEATGDSLQAAKQSLQLLNKVVEAVKTDDVWTAMGIDKNDSIKEVVTEVLDSLSTIEDATITQGDVLVLQMTTNVISSTISTYVAQAASGSTDVSPVKVAEDLLSGVQNIQNVAGELDGSTKGFFDFKIGDLLDKLEG
ncbi:MAG: hypothetical protein SPF89_02230 [Sphaerochaetaceae bacterium]|nr:hypothetical protein [Spirochaetales bacterium]MDY5498903.1 hypothetical protein [Sphaerochaetaceae bacterium]